MALCHITGTLFIPDGTEAANRRVHFQKLAGDVVTDDYIGAVVPEAITTKTDENGAIDVTLLTGYYVGAVLDRRGNRTYTFKATVPDQATASVTDVIAASDPILPLPAWLQAALEARDEALQYAADASADADRAEASADSIDLRIYKTRPDAVAAISGGLVLPDGSQFLAEGLLYSFQSGSTAIPDMIGVIPLGDLNAAHFGFSPIRNGSANRNAVLAACTYAGGQKVVVETDDDFNFNTLTLSNMDVDLEFRGAGRAIAQSNGFATLSGSWFGVQSVTEITTVAHTVGIRSLQLARLSVADVSEYAPGDVIRVVSDDIDPFARDGYTARRGEHAVVASVAPGYIYLGTDKLESQDFFLTNVRVGRMPRNKVSVKFPTCVLLGASTGASITVRNLVRPKVHADLENLGWIGIGLRGTYGAEISGSVKVKPGVSHLDLTYGVHPVGCTGDIVSNYSAWGCRHAFTTGYNSVEPGSASLESFGPCRDEVVQGGKDAFSLVSSWDDHEGNVRTTFRDCTTVDSSGAYAYVARGRDTRIINGFADSSCDAFLHMSRDHRGYAIIDGGASLCRILEVSPGVHVEQHQLFVRGHANNFTAPFGVATVSGTFCDVYLENTEIECRMPQPSAARVIQLDESFRVHLSNTVFRVNAEGTASRLFAKEGGANAAILGDFSLYITGQPMSFIVSASGGSGGLLNFVANVYSPFTGAVTQGGGNWAFLGYEVNVIDASGTIVTTRSPSANTRMLGFLTDASLLTSPPAQRALRLYTGGVMYTSLGTASVDDWRPDLVNVQSGTTGSRPTTGLFVGRVYFDTTLGKPVWWRGAAWVDSSGATV